MIAKTNKKSVFEKDISSVPNKHKPYFEVDENNKITSYKREIRIDTAFLKARLTSDEYDNLLDHLEGSLTPYPMNEVKASGYVVHSLVFDLTEVFGVYIKLMPYEQINAEIQLHAKFTNNLQGNSSYILDILNTPKWFITRMDIATDYTTPFNTSAYLRRNGNQKQVNFDTSSWAGSTSNPHKKAVDSHYDRAKKDESNDSSFTNRFEVKLFFKESDNMTFANLNHALIVERLSKEMFIPCLTYSNFRDKQVNTNRGEKDFIDLIKRSKEADKENYIKLHLSDSQWKTFRNHFKACRDDIEKLYIDKRNEIYDFLLAHH